MCIVEVAVLKYTTLNALHTEQKICSLSVHPNGFVFSYSTSHTMHFLFDGTVKKENSIFIKCIDFDYAFTLWFI